ncbi:hypothetical protein [Desulfococcus sp.]|uniref:hypothetical protein n=1 Tax=Desulfococcus sp. TaxID=2025834 RepID=UPI003D0A2F16
MRKAIVVIVLIGIVAGGGVVWYLNRPAASDIQPAELLPEDTLVMIEATHLKESVDTFRAGPLGRAFSGIDLPACMGAFNADPEDIEQVSRLQSLLKTSVDSPWFDILFGDLAVMAVMRPDPASLRVPSERLWHESAVMVLQPKKPAEMIQWVGKMFSGDVTITPQTTEGVRMDRVDTGDGRPLFVAVHRGLGLVAMDPKPIVRCLGHREADAFRPLSVSDDYAALRTELSAPDPSRCFVYVDLHAVLDIGLGAANRQNTGDADTTEAEKLWKGFNQAGPVIGAVMTDNGQVLHHRWRIRYNPADLPPEAARVLGGPPETNSTLPWVPETVLYYGWQNNLDQVLASVLDFSRLDAEEKAEFRNEFEAITGVDFEDAVNAFGRQVAVIIQDIRIGAMFPVPELALLAEVGQPEVIHRLMEAVVRNFGVAMKTETDEGGFIRYVPLPFGEDISPAYAIRDGFLVTASSRGFLKDLLAQKSVGKNLSDSPFFGAVDKSLTDPNNQAAYLRLDRAAARTGDLIKWVISLAVMTGKADDANQMIYLSGKVVEPILHALAQYPAVGSRTILRENGIHADVYILKPRPE